MTTNLWSPTSRSLCLNSRPLLHTCYKIDSLAARLAQRHARSISNYSVSQGLRGSRSGGLRQWGREAQETGSSFARQTATRSFASKSKGPIVTKYHDLPKNYELNTGLPFRATPLTKDEVLTIFGKPVDPTAANKLLQLLHGHRVAGTLEDPSSITTVSGIKKRQMELGLEWLRRTVPVDEVVNAGLRAEEELAAMGEKVGSTSSKTGKWEPNKAVGKEGVYGHGVLDQIKQMNKEKARKEAAAKAAAEKKEEKKRRKEMLRNPEAVSKNTTTSLDTVRPKVTMETYEGSESYKYWVARAKLTDSDKPPDMTKFQKLWPSMLFLVGTLAASFTLVSVYTPPEKSARLWPELPPSAATLAGLLILNTVILVAWRIPPLWRPMNKYFVSVVGYPYALSSIGSIFSHQEFKHYASNMLLLMLIGTKLHEEVGRANFLALFLCTGVFSSVTTLTVCVLRGVATRSSLGASGAIMGIATAYLTLKPDAKLELFGFPPEGWTSIPAISIFALWVLLDVVGLTWEIKKGIPPTKDLVAHLAGCVAGFGGSQFLRLRQERRKAVQKERLERLEVGDGGKEGVVSK